MIYGYARRSTDMEDQAESLTRQNQRIRDLVANERPGQTFGGVVSETVSATKVPYDQRPEFMQLLERLRPGDELVVENIYRLDRGTYRMPALLEILSQRKITLTVIDLTMFRDGIPLGEVQGKIAVCGLMMAGAIWSENHRQGRIRSIQNLKAAGKPWNSVPPIGKKWGEDEHGKSTWEKDIDAQGVIREAVYRHHGIWHENPGVCEPLLEVAKRFANKKISIPRFRGKSNLGIKNTSPPHQRRRLLARWTHHPRTKCRWCDWRILKRVYSQYVNALIAGEEFGVAIEKIVEFEPERERELRWLQKVFREQYGEGLKVH